MDKNGVGQRSPKRPQYFFFQVSSREKRALHILTRPRTSLTDKQPPRICAKNSSWIWKWWLDQWQTSKVQIFATPRCMHSSASLLGVFWHGTWRYPRSCSFCKNQTKKVKKTREIRIEKNRLHDEICLLFCHFSRYAGKLFFEKENKLVAKHRK